MKRKSSLYQKYPPSEPCGCEICKKYCARPGWWTVAQAKKAADAGYARRMMVEVSPERNFGVLSPAFTGCGGGVALQAFAKNGCNFFSGGLCELHATGHLPLECAFCHHERVGDGAKCHADLENDWNTAAGRECVSRWLKEMRINKKILFADL